MEIFWWILAYFDKLNENVICQACKFKKQIIVKKVFDYLKSESCQVIRLKVYTYFESKIKLLHK